MYNPNIDAFSIGISMPHETDLLHKGAICTASFIESVAAAGQHLTLFETPKNKEAHIKLGLAVGADFTFKMYENPTGITGGSVEPGFNRNRNYDACGKSVIKEDVTVTNEGTKIEESFLFGGTGIAAIGSMSAGAHWVLKKNTKYLFKFTNLSQATDYFSLTITWSECKNTPRYPW